MHRETPCKCTVATVRTLMSEENESGFVLSSVFEQSVFDSPAVHVVRLLSRNGKIVRGDDLNERPAALAPPFPERDPTNVNEMNPDNRSMRTT